MMMPKAQLRPSNAMRPASNKQASSSRHKRLKRMFGAISVVRHEKSAGDESEEDYRQRCFLKLLDKIPYDTSQEDFVSKLHGTQHAFKKLTVNV